MDEKDISSICLEFTASPFPNTPQMGEATLAILTTAGVFQMNAMGDGPATKSVAGMIEWFAKSPI